MSIAPTNASVLLGNQQRMLANVDRVSDPSVFWSVNGTQGGSLQFGTIDDAGLYTAPVRVISPGVVAVSATSVADTAKPGTASVQVVSDISVDVVPQTATVGLGAMQTFHATVKSQGHPDPSVVWSVTGAGCPGACGLIDLNGNFVAPAQLPAGGNLNITAQSVADPSKQASAQVTLAANASQASTTVYNVKSYGGAVCDGITDDTAAIQKTLTDAGTAMNSAGGSGIVYFPPSTGPCVVHVLTWPALIYKGWLYSLFDNALQADTLILASSNAYVGRTSNFQGDSGSFVTGPSATWIQTKSFSGPFVDMSGLNQVSIDGLNIQGRGWDGGPAVHVHDNAGNGSVYITIKNSTVGSENAYALGADASAPNITAGFGMVIENCSFASAVAPTMRFVNYGIVTIRGQFIAQGLSITNAGIPSNGDFLIEDVLSESLANNDFLTLFPTNGPISDITLKRVFLADSVNSWLVKQVSPNNQLTNVKIEMIPAGGTSNGLIDPSSSPQLLSVFCEGYGCDQALTQSQGALYLFFGFPPRSPALFYGSRYVHDPLQTSWQ
ncbi:MAG: glycosyl hydrolase family 28-related protein [Candidatus Acidiferrum sp.]